MFVVPVQSHYLTIYHTLKSNFVYPIFINKKSIKLLFSLQLSKWKALEWKRSFTKKANHKGVFIFCKDKTALSLIKEQQLVCKRSGAWVP